MAYIQSANKSGIHMPSLPKNKKTSEPISDGFSQILKERFSHSCSNLVYDTISLLWHMDEEGEKLVSKLASKVVIGLFCLEYLSHLNEAVKENAGIKNNVTTSDLTDDGVIDGIKKRLKVHGKMNRHVKDIIESLISILETADVNDLDELTKIAHAGDYLISSLQDMKSTNRDDYNLWLYSLPHYYKKDMQETIGLTRTLQDNKRNFNSGKSIRSRKSTEVSR